MACWRNSFSPCQRYKIFNTLTINLLGNNQHFTTVPNYLISAIFTEVVTTDHALDGVMYPSVQAGGQLGFNVAITPSAVEKK